MLPAKRQNAAVNNSAIGRALARFKTERKEAARRRPAGIGFLIDATSSRMPAWAEAQQIQAQMFRSVAGMRALSLRLVHFGGGSLTDHGWMSSPEKVAATMRDVRCIAGPTRVLPGLRAFLQHEQPSAIILVGDCFEENRHEIAAVALDLRAAGIRVFGFLEGDDAVAAAVFRELAQTTGGRFAWFGAELPLRDLCEGVALLTTGGEQAVKRLQNRKVRQLLLTGPAQT